MAIVDVVVPCYQHGHFLRECVTSVLTQDIRDVRVLIIDNASTDDSLAVARRLAEQDRRVKVMAHPVNLGHHASFNEGIDWASSPFFVLLMADDLLAPGCLARAVGFMNQHADVVFTHGRSIPLGQAAPMPEVGRRADKARWRISTGREFIARVCSEGMMHIPSSTLVIRTAAQKRAGHHRRALQFLDDLEMWLRLACYGNVAETRSLQGIRLNADAGPRSMSKDSVPGGDLMWTEAVIESFFANEGAALFGGDQLHRIARRTLGQRAYWSAVSSFVRGHGVLSRDLFRFSLAHCPSCAFLPPMGYLFRKKRTLFRIAQVIAEATRSPRGQTNAIRQAH